MTKEEAHEWATVNAGRKFRFSGDTVVKAQEVTVVGSYDSHHYDRWNPLEIAVALSDGTGWRPESISGLRFAGGEHDVAGRTYRFVSKTSLIPCPEASPPPSATSEAFARAHRGETLTFRESWGEEVRGRVVGYDERYVLIERLDGRGWEIDNWRPGLLEPKKSGLIYWWVSKDTLVPEEVAKKEAAAPEPKKADPAETFARAHLGERWAGKWGCDGYEGVVVGYTGKDLVILDVGEELGWSHVAGAAGTWLIGPQAGPRYWHLLVGELVRRVGEVEAKVEEERPEFVPGDVVYLKSGGPAMTVAEPADDEGEHLCLWFPSGNWAEGASYDHFKPTALTKTRPPTP